MVSELNSDARAMEVNTFGQCLEAGEKYVAGNAEFVCRVCAPGIAGRGVLSDDQSGSAPGSFLVVGDDRLTNLAVGFGNLYPHGRHRDPIAELEIANSRG